jgi:hypothetical protein
MLARCPSFEYYPEISPGLDFIELTRDEFVKWLLVRGFEIPTFWGPWRQSLPGIGPAAELEQRRQKAQAPSGAAARLPRGRPPEYNRGDIADVAEDLIKGGVDPTLDHFVGRVRSKLEFESKKPPGDTVLTEICAPIYKRERSKRKQ